jgi:hypothetical protein
MARRERNPARLKSRRLVGTMRRGFAESKWRMATMLSSNASSKTGNDLAAHAGRFFKTTECNTLARYRRNRAMR